MYDEKELTTDQLREAIEARNATQRAGQATLEGSDDILRCPHAGCDYENTTHAAKCLTHGCGLV